AIRKTIGRMNELEVMRAKALTTMRSTIDVQQQEQTAIARSNARKDALVRLLNTERGQRILAAEAARRQSAELQRNSQAQEKNAAATERGARAQRSFLASGRESLGMY